MNAGPHPLLQYHEPNCSPNIRSARVEEGFACNTWVNNLPPGKTTRTLRRDAANSLAICWRVSETRSDPCAFKQRTSHPAMVKHVSTTASPSQAKFICKTRSGIGTCGTKLESQIYRLLVLAKVASSRQDLSDGMVAFSMKSLLRQATTLPSLRRSTVCRDTCRNLGVWCSFIQRWNVAFSKTFRPKSYHTPITAKKYCMINSLQKFGCMTLLHPEVECCIVRHCFFRKLSTVPSLRRSTVW